MNTYNIGITFATEKDLGSWYKANTEKHEDGIRNLYNHEVVWVVNTSQQVNPYTMERGPITLDSIQTWKRKGGV